MKGRIKGARRRGRDGAENGLFSVPYCPRSEAESSLINKLPMTDRNVASLHRRSGTIKLTSSER